MEPFVLQGTVIPGKQLGTQLGFPTANILYDPAQLAWPEEGVYAGIAHVEGEPRSYAAILNQGRHPTAPGGAPTVEAHLIDHPNEALYGRQLTLTYCHYLRPEVRFPTLEALQAQLAQDRLNALAWANEHAPALLTNPEGATHGTV